MTSPSGFSAGGNSSIGAGGFLGTTFVGTGSPVGLAYASWIGPRACTSTPAGVGGSSWPKQGTTPTPNRATTIRPRCADMKRSPGGMANPARGPAGDGEPASIPTASLGGNRDLGEA